MDALLNFGSYVFLPSLLAVASAKMEMSVGPAIGHSGTGA